MSELLAGIRVLELATGISGPYLGKLFADHGADVIKVEPPSG
ncbi:MAG: CoA transferase, partial [Acidimicrobiaceae bacterium]|nr:CoA transferase [Acidimicrobiaceae bacterium]